MKALNERFNSIEERLLEGLNARYGYRDGYDRSDSGGFGNGKSGRIITLV